MALIERLRAPGGCPWDAEQTHHTLARHLIEETYEVIEAIEALPASAPGSGPEPVPDGAYEHLEEELGDLACQVIFHATFAREAGAFTITDVLAGIHDKLVRRHPHVFGDVAVSGADEVVANWEVIKREEKGRTSLMDGVSRHLPSLLYAHKLYRKAASAGLTFGTADEALARAGPSCGAWRRPLPVARWRPTRRSGGWGRRWRPSSIWPAWPASTASRPCGAGRGGSRTGSSGSRRWRPNEGRRSSQSLRRTLPPSGSRRLAFRRRPWSAGTRSGPKGCPLPRPIVPIARLLSVVALSRRNEQHEGRGRPGMPHEEGVSSTMKRIGLVVAAAMLGTTGVASAGIAVNQFAASTSASSESVKLDAKTESLAANCWVATGAAGAGCNTLPPARRFPACRASMTSPASSTPRP